MTQPTIDLHIHSTHSDGKQTTAELLDEFKNLGLQYVSFTDHDNVGCYGDLPALKDKIGALHIIPGIELSFVHDGEMRHMLGYGVDIKNIDAFLQEKYAFEISLAKQQGLLDTLKHICTELGLIYEDDLRVETGVFYEAFNIFCTTLRKFPENLEKYPFLNDNTEFFWDHYVNKNSPFFVDESVGVPNMQEIIQVIHDAGGLAFLAHPYGYSLASEQVEDMVLRAVDNGVDGIEVQHSSNLEGCEAHLRALAEQNKKFMSGGSDYHGPGKPKRKLATGNGNVLVPYADIAPWLQKMETIHA